MVVGSQPSDGSKKKHRTIAILAKHYPGLISPADLTPELVEGLILNIPTLEAIEDVRFIMSLGATFGGKESRPYIDALFSQAYDKGDAAAASAMLDVADAKRGAPVDAPAMDVP